MMESHSAGKNESSELVLHVGVFVKQVRDRKLCCSPSKCRSRSSDGEMFRTSQKSVHGGCYSAGHDVFSSGDERPSARSAFKGREARRLSVLSSATMFGLPSLLGVAFFFCCCWRVINILQSVIGLEPDYSTHPH